MQYLQDGVEQIKVKLNHHKAVEKLCILSDLQQNLNSRWADC